jgi:transposase
MSQVNTLDFTGQSIFCGIDTHKNNWSVCIRNDERELRVFSQDPDPSQLGGYLKKNYPGATIIIAYEAGFCGFWPYQGFVEQGLKCQVVHAADIPQTDKNRRFKTDKVDCRKIARELGNKNLNAIYVPSQSTVEARSLVRSRAQFVKDQTRVKNRISSFLHFMGYKIPKNLKKSTHYSKRFIQWLEELPLSLCTKTTMTSHIYMWKNIRAELLKIEKSLRTLSQSEEYREKVDLLRSVPGIGITTSLILLTELENIERFKDKDSLCSYAGFSPNVYSSADKTRVRGITRHCNHIVRTTLVESAWMAISKDPALLMTYNELKKRMNYNLAVIRIAKKLLRRVSWVLKHKQPYQLGRVK